jgi:hypothetical protein
MTLEQLQKKKQESPTAEKPRINVLKSEPAGEPTPALRYRMWITPTHRKPGSALLHFSRAMLLCRQIPDETRNRYQEWVADDANRPSARKLSDAVQVLQNVYHELHEMALCEDTKWDHRIRDRHGVDMYGYLLEDVQESRLLARLLRLKISHHLNRGEFDEAISAITDGHHLAAFIGQGETLIQRLVGIACVAMMRDGIEEAIQTPGCPNLYWAMASVPRPLIPVSDAIDWEMNTTRRVIPQLQEAMEATWTEEQALQKWSELFDTFQALVPLGISDTNAKAGITIAALSAAEPARQRLIAAGIAEDRVASLPPMQATMADAALELRRVGDNLHKGHLLPAAIADRVLQAEEDKLNNWTQENRYTSVGAVLGGLLFPAVRQAREAETRTQMAHNRLMTVEALRMYAQQHAGELPAALSDLQQAPAMPNPFTGTAFEYESEIADGKPTAVLRAVMPRHSEYYGTTQLILKAK